MFGVELALLLLGGTFYHGALAQDGEPEGGRLKTVQIARTATAPVIDGQLDDSLWSQAIVIDDLHQINPTEYAEPTVATRVYLVYTDDALYIGAELSDSDAADISSRVLRQGERTLSDDFFGVVLDPFNDRRSGYRFTVNANGVREDLLYQNISQQNQNWEGIWRAAASQNEDGWVAEMEIPFKTLSFDPANDTWGINFMRWVPRKNEWIGWVSRNNTINPSVSGAVIGFSDLEQGLGLDIVPSISLREKKSYSPSMSESESDPSLDVFYKLTPGLNASLTVNTDFSATEVDDRQVDLSRFSLFFPEKRDFFLRDADIFEFGRLGAITNFGSGPTFSRPTLENGRPFFSRRLGLSASGEPVDLEYGGKLSGRIGRWNLGTLAIRQDAFADVDATNAFVGRLSANVLAESALGVIATNGDPRSNLDNSLVGVDFRYLNTRLAGGRTLQGDAWYQQTDTDGLEGDDSAFGFRLQLPSSRGIRGSIGVKELQQNFNPALGFVNRSGIRDHTAELGYTHRPASRFLQSVFGGVDLQRINRISGGLQTEMITFRPLEIETRTRDSLKLRYIANKEVVTEPFEISDGIFITPGEYAFDEYGFDMTTGPHRSLSGTFGYRTGEFYDGDRLMLRGALTWAPSKYFRAGVSYDYNDVELPQGDFVVRLVTLQADIVFSSKLSWVNLIQYDNVSETAGINSRLHWVPEAGREAFIVLNHTLEDLDRDNSFMSTQADLTLKFNYTFRF
jgi:hypothetical protein